MHYKAWIVGALASLAAAQSSVLTFTHVPSTVTDGQAQAITYATNDTSSPVTILLRKGLSNSLQTVETLTTSATGGSYVWTPSGSLQNGDDYALEITQGTQLNYFGPFSVEGASVSASPSSSATGSAISSPSGGVIAPSSSTNSSLAANSTMIANAATTSGVSAGIGSSMPSNGNMSMATLTSGPSPVGDPAANIAAASTASASGAGFQGSPTGSAATPSSKNGVSELVAPASQIALVFGAMAAVFCLQ